MLDQIPTDVTNHSMAPTDGVRRRPFVPDALTGIPVLSRGSSDMLGAIARAFAIPLLATERLFGLVLGKSGCVFEQGICLGKHTADAVHLGFLTMLEVRCEALKHVQIVGKLIEQEALVNVPFVNEGSDQVQFGERRDDEFVDLARILLASALPGIADDVVRGDELGGGDDLACELKALHLVGRDLTLDLRELFDQEQECAERGEGLDGRPEGGCVLDGVAEELNHVAPPVALG